MAEDNTRNAAMKSKAPTNAAEPTSSKRSKNNSGDAVDKDDTSVVSSENSNKILISARANDFSSKTWWMVDMHSDDEENSTTQGATALVKRCMRVYNWSLEKTRKVLTAYRQFLTLKKEHKDWNATILSPSYLVDQMWHQHILDVVNYTHDMMLLCGHVVGHNPDGALDLQKKAKRDSETRKALEERFANKYDKEIWRVDTSSTGSHRNQEGNIFRVTVTNKNGDEEQLTINENSSMQELFDAYAQRKEVRASDLVFAEDSFHGGRILPTDTPLTMGWSWNHWSWKHQFINVYENNQFRVNVIDENGNQTTCIMSKMTSTMQELFDTYANGCIFTVSGVGRVSANDMPINIKHLRDNNQINVYASEETYLNSAITIRVQHQCGKEIGFKITRGTKLGKLFQAYAKQMGFLESLDCLRFLLDGERVTPDDTPDQLALEDNDRIDCFTSQPGCDNTECRACHKT